MSASKPQSRPNQYGVHLCWTFEPRTACGLIVESQAAPRTDWVIPERRWMGPLGIGKGLITCKNCLATVAK